MNINHLQDGKEVLNRATYTFKWMAVQMLSNVRLNRILVQKYNLNITINIVLINLDFFKYTIVPSITGGPKCYVNVVTCYFLATFFALSRVFFEWMTILRDFRIVHVAPCNQTVRNAYV